MEFVIDMTEAMWDSMFALHTSLVSSFASIFHMHIISVWNVTMLWVQWVRNEENVNEENHIYQSTWAIKELCQFMTHSEPNSQAVPCLCPRHPMYLQTQGDFPHSSPLSCRGNGMVYACLVASMKSNPPSDKWETEMLFVSSIFTVISVDW